MFFRFTSRNKLDDFADLTVEDLANAQEYVGGDVVAVVEPGHRGGRQFGLLAQVLLELFLVYQQLPQGLVGGSDLEVELYSLTHCR
ncbi:Uncharacterised protein [Corynebacterium kutscheri]|uniref:Uma2 family endonuclease n=1 Tax=Corynebacterium kutscheri TaxID=35755 RepID=A0AB38VT75_9CORY|nr:Uncharacterised protein [Corynebacterium kutscheri]VEH82293.1 Uncharacterised protein [Corynebacterium kutscheri]